MYLKTDQASTSFPLLLLGAREILRLSGLRDLAGADGNKVGFPFSTPIVSPLTVFRPPYIPLRCCVLCAAPCIPVQ